jgi:hypothetical protein
MRRIGEGCRVGEMHVCEGRRVEVMLHVGEGCRVGEMCVGEGLTSARPSSPAVGDGDARVSWRSGASEKGGASERSLSSGTGAARRGGGDDDGGREVRRRFGGKWLSADQEGDGA